MDGCRGLRSVAEQPRLHNSVAASFLSGLRKQRHPRLALPLGIAALLLVLALPAVSQAKTPLRSTEPAATPATMPADLNGAMQALPDAQTPGGARSLVQWALIITVVAVAPAVLVMITSFTRIIVVLGLLRQALATQQTPPNQVLVGLALFMTLAVMAPVLQDVYSDAASPYLAGKTTQVQAAQAGVERVRKFMIGQIEAAGNVDDVYLFLGDDVAARKDLSWRDVPTLSLIPAFVVSELKVAFLIGFRIFLPFVVIDLLVASVLTSMGMLMLPPVLVSLPLKLLLFIMVDGWHLVVGTLMKSFG